MGKFHTSRHNPPWRRRASGRTERTHQWVASLCAVGLLGLGAGAEAASAADLLSFRPSAGEVSPPKGAGYVLRDGSIHISGAENAQVILEGFDALFAQAHPGTRFTLDLKGTGTGIPMLTHGVTPFAPMGRGVTPVELTPYVKIVGRKPLEIRIARTAYASETLATSLGVYVNSANPIDRITVAEVRRAFTAGNPEGDISQWGQLGETGRWAGARIHAVAGSEHAGFGSYLKATHFDGRALAAQVENYPNSAEVLKRVGDDSLAIGVAASGRHDPGVKMLALAEGAGAVYATGEPSTPTAGQYPFTRYLYAYVRKEPGKPVDRFVKEYLRLVLSREGQQVIAAQPHGYLPLSAADAAAELAKLEALP